MGRLAFGPGGAPNAWTRVVPFLRPLCLAAFAWGLATLMMLQLAPAGDGKGGGDKQATRLVFVADLSPSMYLVDAGPDGKQTRHARMKEVVDGILQRVSGNLRFAVIAFYTESMPVRCCRNVRSFMATMRRTPAPFANCWARRTITRRIC